MFWVPERTLCNETRRERKGKRKHRDSKMAIACQRVWADRSSCSDDDYWEQTGTTHSPIVWLECPVHVLCCMCINKKVLSDTAIVACLLWALHPIIPV